jgi:protein-disulfide isomerase
MAGKNQNVVIAIIVVAVAAVGGYWYISNNSGDDIVSMAEKAPASAASDATPSASGTPRGLSVDLPPLPEGMTEMVLGDPDAPVTMLEFASLTCPHCADFDVDRLPDLKKEYIDKGLLKIIFRDYPLDGLALRAAMISRCAGPDKYFAYINTFFHQQAQWLTQTPLDDMKRIARFAGMSSADIDQCLEDKDLQQGIVQMMQDAGSKLNVNSTPTFIIGDAQFSGTRELSHYQGLIDAELAKAGVSKE